MPGTLYPLEAPRGDPARSEVRVWQALRDALPDGWTAWHSLRTRDRDRVVRECDFVVAAPEFGLLVLEVKGGRLEIRGGDWYQDGRRLDKSPLTQATAAAHALDSHLARHGAQRPPFGAAVVLSDTEFSAGPSAGDLEGVVLGRQDLPYLADAIRAAAQRAVPRKRVPATDIWMPAVHALWGEQWVACMTPRDEAASAGRRLFRLDEEQLRLFEVVAESPRAVVAGAAGSGKTLLARELCLRRHAEGARVLYLCFTKALAQAMKRAFAAAPGGPSGAIRAATVRQLAMEHVTRARKVVDLERPGAWEEISFEAAQAAEALGAEPWDLIVVDEAFDLSSADWLLVDVLSRGRGLWAFADARQQFWRDRELPADLFRDAARLTLPRQHRNPAEISAFAARYLPAGSVPAASDASDELPEGRLGVALAPDDGLREAVAAQVRRWLAAGAKPCDIAVVTLAGLEKTEIVDTQDLCGLRIEVAEADDAARNVVADTFLRFKGFERPFIVVTELGGEAARSGYDTRMHIALTRASSEVAIVCTAAEAAQDPRIAALAGGAAPAA
jgi:ATP:corrinoid adenosyltransferase